MCSLLLVPVLLVLATAGVLRDENGVAKWEINSTFESAQLWLSAFTSSDDSDVITIWLSNRLQDEIQISIDMVSAE